MLKSIKNWCFRFSAVRQVPVRISDLLENIDLYSIHFKWTSAVSGNDFEIATKLGEKVWNDFTAPVYTYIIEYIEKYAAKLTW